MILGTCHCGKVSYQYDPEPDSATACNCTVCRRYGVLWIYDWDGEGVSMSGPTRIYLRGDRDIEFHFCPDCGCVMAWRGVKPDEYGRTRMAVNVRMAEPESVAALPVRHFDGLDSWQDMPDDGRKVHDMWF